MNAIDKAKSLLRELTMDMSSAEYGEFMLILADWASYQAEIADWNEDEE